MNSSIIWTNDQCSACSNLVSCRTQVVVATQAPFNGLLAIGEAPGADEDIKGEGFVGAAGKTLDKLLYAHGINRDDYGRANICRCRPPENRKPTKSEVDACIPFLANLLEQTKPKVILAVGGTPTAFLCGKASLTQQIESRTIESQWSSQMRISLAHKGIQEALNHVKYVVPMPHTSPLAFNRNAPSGEKWAEVAKRQVAIAVSLLKS
jgi:uracil-DNA glycosylase